MSIDLPEVKHFDDFYIWFNKEEKKEYYSTSMYFYKADFSIYETAYKDFFYAYGFEILKDVNEDYKFELKGKYEDDETYLNETKKIYDNLKEQLIYIQENITDAVNYIYNINENEELKPFTHSQRYAVYLINRKGKLYFYIKNYEVIQEESAYTEYRKTYQQKFGIVNKNKDDKKLKKEFETWKKQAKEKITKLKHGELTEDDVYEWLQENK